jgi:hypothetical protein
MCIYIDIHFHLGVIIASKHMFLYGGLVMYFSAVGKRGGYNKIKADR